MTRDEKQAVLDDHLERHGSYRPDVFLAEASDPDHPAHGYFRWDEAAAAHQYRMWQAREFVDGLRCERRQETSVAGTSRVVMMPVVVSERKGEYVSTATPSGEAILVREARERLFQWVERYESTVSADDVLCLRGVIRRLDVKLSG